MNKISKNWDSKHQEYNQSGWINEPTIFAESVLQYLPKSGEILDLGAGQGQDSRFFASKGYEVTSTDFSDVALTFNNAKIPPNLKYKVKLLKLDLSEMFPFKNESFDAIYAHLSVHYFNKKITQQIFDEIYRVTKPKGIIALVLNSTSDPEYKTGNKIEEDFFELPDGMKKRFFGVESIRPFLKKFNTILLDNKGETHKDKKKGVSNLIRYVGTKK